jgi:sterol desaturase/sphingolipid hydroxylase (fatty acid hydroxylase superfamily)
MVKNVIALLFIAALAVFTFFCSTRTWRDGRGNELEARLERVDSEFVVLSSRGELYRIHKNRLSPRDRLFVVARLPFIILVLAVSICLAVYGYAGALIAAFRSGIVWGTLCLVLPVFLVFYAVFDWEDVRRYVLALLFGLALSGYLYKCSPELRAPVQGVFARVTSAIDDGNDDAQAYRELGSLAKTLRE